MNWLQKNKKTCLTLFFVFAYVGASISQEAWDLKKCIDYAHEHNIQVKQAVLNTELSKANLWQNKANVLPTLNGNAPHSTAKKF